LNRWRVWVLLIVVGILAGCIGPPVEIPPENPIAVFYPELWKFLNYCQDNWEYEKDRPWELCQSPRVSYSRMKGDCDDWAVMIAYYTQDVYGYDSCIVLGKYVDGPGHAIAFVACTKSFVDRMADYCGRPYSYLGKDEIFYIPLDWTECPDWYWVELGEKVTLWEWDDLVGKPLSTNPEPAQATVSVSSGDI